MAISLATLKSVASRHPIVAAFVSLYVLFIIAAVIGMGFADGLLFALVMPWVALFSFLVGLCFIPWWAGVLGGDSGFIPVFTGEMLLYLACVIAGVRSLRSQRFGWWLWVLLLLLAANGTLNFIFDEWAADL